MFGVADNVPVSRTAALHGSEAWLRPEAGLDQSEIVAIAQELLPPREQALAESPQFLRIRLRPGRVGAAQYGGMRRQLSSC